MPLPATQDTPNGPVPNRKPGLLAELMDFLDRFIRLAAVPLSVVNVLTVIGMTLAMLLDGMGLTALDTGPVWHDFQSFWSAGLAARQDMAGLTYDLLWYEHHLAATIGPQAQSFGWHYPPQFFLLLAPLTLLPLPVAFTLWILLPLVLLGVLVYRLIPHRFAPLIALGVPLLMIHTGYAQNGIFSTLIIGFALLPLLSGRQPSGFYTSLLAFKPHLGLVFPVAYASGGHWRSFVLTCLWLLVQIVLTGWIFGIQVWLDFLASLQSTRTILFDELGAGAFHYASVYGSVRLLHGNGLLALMGQMLATGLTLYALWRVWRQPVAPALKAALLVASIPLTAPYLMHYDMSINLLACTLLIHHRPFGAWHQHQRLGLAALWLLSLGNVGLQKMWSVPAGLFCNLAVYALVATMIRHESVSQNAISAQE